MLKKGYTSSTLTISGGVIYLSALFLDFSASLLLAQKGPPTPIATYWASLGGTTDVFFFSTIVYMHTSRYVIIFAYHDIYIYIYDRYRYIHVECKLS